MWDFCVSTVAERRGFNPPHVQESMDVPAVYACIIGYFGDIALKVIQQRLKIVPPHFFKNLVLKFRKRLGW